MPLTLRDLVADPELRLTAHAAQDVLHHPITWVHTSELDDPTPFLEGGEVLLTTGLGLSPDPEACQDYVDRLAAAGVAGLGFGVGINHREIPRPLVDAACRTGLPLLEVPREVPFIAISKSVSRALAAEEYAELRHTGRAQHELARAASGAHGLPALIDKLAGLVGGWALLLDPAGMPRHASPQAAASASEELGPEVARLLRKRGLATSVVSLRGAEISLQVLGTRARGVLAVGRAEPWTTTEHHIVNSAASLLTLALEQQHVVGDARRRLRAGTFELLLRNAGELARRPPSELLTEFPVGELRVFSVAGTADTDTVLDMLEAETAALAHPPFLADHDGRVVAVAADASQGADWLTGLPQRDASLRVGISEPCTLDGLATAYRQAVDAARHATGAAVRFSELAGHGLLRLVPTEDARAFAGSLLAPLREHDAGTRRGGAGDGLMSSLREWLAQHGQWDPAASRLGVHRHTLRNRIRKVEGLLGRSLDQPGVRAELWLALQVIEQDT
ncbi:PucR family transcriptional regulator [Haloactinomyces albus]|uniref:Purine catabolism regulator n=1 Tax=Haloactinomyces albus TaxID=1352928 RepID=A0AAE3ZIA2_9ACTN|nr:PucR family transcriptional regulator ligand-binding domain-containing protein [Haloactinomyces albus]MDR7304160.1 purine catabolism regulator [Haloactinomyces albus]